MTLKYKEVGLYNTTLKFYDKMYVYTKGGSKIEYFFSLSTLKNSFLDTSKKISPSMSS